MTDNSQVSYESMDTTTKKKFKYWQTRTIVATMIGYALYYFLRKNFSMAMPGMQADLGITKVDLGIFLTLHGLIYGFSRFANGFLGDRVTSRHFMVLGLVLCAVCNIIFGFSSALLVFGIVWLFNGWFQGMGFPPCVRLLTHWIPPQQLATKMSVWNTSHSIGAALVVILCGYIYSWGLSWRWCFYIPSIIALLGAVFLWFALRDTPRSVGLPELDDAGNKKAEGKKTAEEKAAFKKVLREKVFENPYIWLLAVANFFVYIIRFGVFDWGPMFLQEWKGVDISQAGWMVAGFEIAGIVGMITAGWATDKFFGSRAIRVCVLCMAMATVAVVAFSQLENPPMIVATGVLMVAGFFIYAPQALIGIAAANLATKQAAGTASGFTGLFGYASALPTGIGMAYLAEHYGWAITFDSLIIVGIIGTIVFALGWKAKANGYED